MIKIKSRFRTSFFISIWFVGFSQILFSQVGINTANPQGVLHVDPKNDTSGSVNELDDVVISSDGYMGLGTVTPEAPLHIKTDGSIPALLIDDGTQGDQYVLTTDENGVFSWENKDPKEGIFGFKSTSGVAVSLTNANSNRIYNTGSGITLPKGRWLVYVVMFLNRSGTAIANSFFEITSTFATAGTSGLPNPGLSTTMDITSLISSDIEGGYIIKASSLTTNGAGGVYGGMMTGFIIINNTSDTSKTYYLLSGLAKGNVSSTITIGNNASENAVVGIQLPEK